MVNVSFSSGSSSDDASSVEMGERPICSVLVSLK